MPGIEKEIGPLKNGFFIEVGALDGVEFTNTLYFESAHNWTGKGHHPPLLKPISVIMLQFFLPGLLIEAQKWKYDALVKLGRNVWSINACLSPTRHPEEIIFTNSGVRNCSTFF